MKVNERINYQGGMDLQRYAQEASLRAMEVILADVVKQCIGGAAITEESAAIIAKYAVLVGYEMAEAYGIDPVPRSDNPLKYLNASLEQSLTRKQS